MNFLISRNLYDRHLRKDYKEHLKSSVVLETFGGKYIPGILIRHQIMKSNNNIFNSFFELKIDNKSSRIYGSKVKRLYSVSSYTFHDYSNKNFFYYQLNKILKNKLNSDTVSEISKFIGEIYIYKNIS